MSAPRTVDPSGKTASTRFMGIRIADAQVHQVKELARRRGCTQSVLIRRLILEEWERVEKQG